MRNLNGNVPIESPAPDLAERLHQLRTIKSGYERLAAKDPLLPTSDSALPSLLALRRVGKVVSEDKAHLSIKQEQIAEARQRRAKEELKVREENLLTEALNKRIEELRLDHTEKSQRTAAEEAQRLIEEERKRRLDLDRDRKALTRTLVNFINDPLARMLAAEDLGGPVVGELLDISDEMLEAGFTPLGKPKKHKPSAGDQDDEKRRRRIAQIWGNGEEDDSEDDLPGTEREAAALHMRSLVEELLNAAADMKADEGTYVEIKKDSAAVRFLVRANVAEFHPEDARKLRLIDFVSGYEDEDEDEDEDAED